MKRIAGLGLCVAALAAGCRSKQAGLTFAEDVEFLRRHTNVVVLVDKTGQGCLAVCPAYQGRGMTSTAGGCEGPSYGWINRELISAHEIRKHINPYGGEDRFWIGPEGGQFAVFFKKGEPFDLEHWQTPAPFDTEKFELVTHDPHKAVFSKRMQLKNYSGTQFDLEVDRTLEMLEADKVAEHLGVTIPPAVKVVGYQSVNKVTNTGKQPWEKKTGLLSIWILGMYNTSPATTVVAPFVPGPEDKLGPIVNADYFGRVPPDRLVVKADQGVLYFKADGKYRSKIGLSPQRAKPVIGSYDAGNCLLTIVQYTKPQGATDYVNSMWQQQKKPYAGDVVNSYNDGGSLGKFYELETSSPAAALKPGQSIQHTHRTIHLQGSAEDLDPIAKAVLGVGLSQIKSALK